jgi:hypothetical protein
MLFQWNNWSISSYKYGYVIRRRIGNSRRWEATSWHATFKEAVRAMRDERVRMETADIIIKALEESDVQIETAPLIAKIDEINTEIMEVINGTQQD